MPQGTVKSFDPRTKGLVILDDDLHEWVVAPEAFATAGVREFRLGQRVRFEFEDGVAGGAVTTVGIVTL